jgi:hypothetical protein
MTYGKLALLAPLLALSLAACGGGNSDLADYYCPAPFTVEDANRLTRFREGAGRDPRDIAWDAVIIGSTTKCTISRKAIEVSLFIRISVSAGPSIGPARTSVPYFVRVLDTNRNVVQSQEFSADFRLSAANPRGSSQEELTLTLPRDASYSIAIGLKPTPEELNYNRTRGAQ